MLKILKPKITFPTLVILIVTGYFIKQYKLPITEPTSTERVQEIIEQCVAIIDAGSFEIIDSFDNLKPDKEPISNNLYGTFNQRFYLTRDKNFDVSITSNEITLSGNKVSGWQCLVKPTIEEDWRALPEAVFSRTAEFLSGIKQVDFHEIKDRKKAWDLVQCIDKGEAIDIDLVWWNGHPWFVKVEKPSLTANICAAAE